MSGRFRLDPRDAHDSSRPAERTSPQVGPDAKRAEPAPPAIAPRPAAPPPPAPRPAPVARAPAAPAPAWKNRRVLLIAAAVVAVLVIGGAVALVATALGYPDKYVLEAGEMPSGMSNARMTRSELDDAGMTRNPGPVDPQRLEEEFGTDTSDIEKAHGQVLTTASGTRIVILAFKYTSEDAAQDAASQARLYCSFANGAALRDGEVLVVLIPEGASRTEVRNAANALREKTSDLKTICGL